MTTRTIRTGAAILAAAASAALAGPRVGLAAVTVPPPAAPAATSPAAEARLRELLTERRNILREAFEQAGRRYAAGQVGIEERHRAEIAALLAEVDLTRSVAERIAVREAVLKLATEMERLARARFAQGQIRREAMTEATLGRVEAQVALGREKAAQAAK
ncbi:MAG TPA: hypothetical protein VM490_08115 [Armatimonadaceae bacterium]|nr:hypothetical protein [Armatimonadaceae bacterium]